MTIQQLKRQLLEDIRVANVQLKQRPLPLHSPPLGGRGVFSILAPPLHSGEGVGG